MSVLFTAHALVVLVVRDIVQSVNGQVLAVSSKKPATEVQFRCRTRSEVKIELHNIAGSDGSCIHYSPEHGHGLLPSFARGSWGVDCYAATCQCRTHSLVATAGRVCTRVNPGGRALTIHLHGRVEGD